MHLYKDLTKKSVGLLEGYHDIVANISGSANQAGQPFTPAKESCMVQRLNIMILSFMEQTPTILNLVGLN